MTVSSRREVLNNRYCVLSATADRRCCHGLLTSLRISRHKPDRLADERAHLNALVSVYLVDDHAIAEHCFVIPVRPRRPGRVNRAPDAAKPRPQGVLKAGRIDGHTELGGVISGVGLCRVVKQGNVACVELGELLDHKFDIVAQINLVTNYLDRDVHPIGVPCPS